MQVNTSTPQYLNISRSSTDINFNAVFNNYTYASITGKVTSGGTTYYSWTAMLPSFSGGLSLAPEIGGGSVTPSVLNPAVALNAYSQIGVGSTVILRRRSSHATFGSIWEVIFEKPKEQSSSGVIPKENEPVLCYWAGWMYDKPNPGFGRRINTQYLAQGPQLNVSSYDLTYPWYFLNTFIAHRYWYLPSVVGPYGTYYLDSDPWGVMYWAWYRTTVALNTSVTAAQAQNPVAYPFQCVVYNSKPNLTPPAFGVYVDTRRYVGYMYTTDPLRPDPLAKTVAMTYPSSTVTSNYKLLPSSYRVYAKSNVVRAYKSSYYPSSDINMCQINLRDTNDGSTAEPIIQDPMKLLEFNTGEYKQLLGAVVSVTARKDWDHTKLLDYNIGPESSWPYPRAYPAGQDPGPYTCFPTQDSLHDPIFSRLVLTNVVVYDQTQSGVTV